jgi:glycosyltransferase involved in cell wall biosynthesis
MLELYKELKKIKPSIIYQNVGGFQTGVAGYYAKKHGAKFIWHIASDDDIAPQWKSNIKRTLRDLPQRNILNYGIKHATLIAAQTRYQADLLKIKFGISSQGIIPIGHPFPEEVPFKTKPLTVLWIANLKPLKRPEIFVRLARYFRERGDVRFVMIGRRGWGKWFEQMQIDIQDLPQLDYVGELAQDQVNHYLSRGHILVNTSRYEGFSNTFVQAWIRKVPVVSLTVDPDQVLVKENIGFKSETFEKLCQDVKTLIDDAAMRERMGEKALHYARNNHSIQKMVFSANRLIDSLIPPYS